MLPAGQDLLEQGHVEWKSGHKMSLVGMRLAFEHAVPVPTAPDLSVNVAPLHVLALLKIVAYQDRPHQRQRDLEDLAFMMEEYVGADDDRLWTDVPSQIEYECRPAFLLGLDLGPLLNESELGIVARIVALLRGEGQDTTRPRFLRGGPARWRVDDNDEDGRLDGVIAAFEAGLAARPQASPAS